MESVKSVLARRDRLFAAAVDAAGPGALDGGGVARAAGAVAGALPAGCHYDAVYRSFTAAQGAGADSAAVRDLCWALAADTAALKAGTPVSPRTFRPDPADAVVQFAAARRLPARRTGPPGGGFGVRYRARVLVGPGAPAEFEFTWSSKFVAWLAARPDGLGFGGRPRPNHPPAAPPYAHYATLVGMRAVLSLAAGPGGVEVRGAACPGGLRDYNRALTAMRHRDGFECPFAFEHHCHACPKGQESCPAAVRPLDLKDETCVACGQSRPHDPAWPSGVCTTCAAAGRRPPT